MVSRADRGLRERRVMAGGPLRRSNRPRLAMAASYVE